MGSDALRYPIADCLYQMIRSSGQPIIKRVNLAEMMVAMIGASRRDDEVYKTDVIKLVEGVEILHGKYQKIFDNSLDDVPERAVFESLLYRFIEDCLAVVTKERLISGSIMERLAGERFKTYEKEGGDDDKL